MGFLGSPKIPTSAAVSTETPPKTASELAKEAEERQKATLVALNAGSAIPQTTVGGGSANVTKKFLLGL